MDWPYLLLASAIVVAFSSGTYVVISRLRTSVRARELAASILSSGLYEPPVLASPGPGWEPSEAEVKAYEERRQAALEERRRRPPDEPAAVSPSPLILPEHLGLNDLYTMCIKLHKEVAGLLGDSSTLRARFNELANELHRHEERTTIEIDFWKRQMIKDAMGRTHQVREAAAMMANISAIVATGVALVALIVQR